MIQPKLVRVAAGAVACVFPAACGLTARADAPATRAADAPATQPARFNEAALPKGYPAPGPLDEVVVKQYPAARAAVVKAADLKDGSDNGMFWPLFQHIKKNHIEMSAPVDMTWSPPASDGKPPAPQAMAFVYGDPTLGRVGRDGVVEVVDFPAATVVSISLRGPYDKDHFTQGLAALNKWLAEHADRYKASGPPRYLGYNSPFVPPAMRLGEVQLPVTVVKAEK